MKKIICFILLTAVLLSVFSFPVFADDNAQSGSGSMEDASKGYAWYNPNQYLWKVTIFVGKSDQASKYSNLQEDFHRIGTIIMKKTGWRLNAYVKFGTGTKVDYYAGVPMEMEFSPKIISDENCPAVPIACGGDIETVKNYFGTTGTLTTVLNAIAAGKDTTATELLSSLSFTIDGVTKSGWAKEFVYPNGTTNQVPWVIVYEPMVVLTLKDQMTQLAFTATEFALCELNGWYDWNYSGGRGQDVAILPEKHLPTSVQLEEPWFGYPVYNVTDDTVKWDYNDVVKGGGWGMRWLPAQNAKTIDYGVYFGTVDKPYVGSSGNVQVYWTNYKSERGTVLCELYRDDRLLWSEYKTINGKATVSSTFSLNYTSVNSIELTAKINYLDRFSETDPTDNMATRILTPTEKPAKNYDFSVSALRVDPSVCDAQDTVTVYFRTDSWDRNYAYNDIPVQVLFNGVVIYTENFNYAAYGGMNHTLKIDVGNSVGINDIVVRINWIDHMNETNTTNNETGSVQLTVNSKIDLGITSVLPNSDYTAGTTVVTSYMIHNYSDYDIVPSDGNNVYFESYYYENSRKVIITTMVWENAVIPANESNLVYFKWTVPQGLNNKTVYCKAQVDSGNMITEYNENNNASAFSRSIKTLENSQTPDTQYEAGSPEGFKVPSLSKPATGKAVWSMWEYENGDFVKKDYGIIVVSGKATVLPDADSPSLQYKNGKWYIKSGYGIEIEYSPTIQTYINCQKPPVSSYTDIQYVTVAFPEFLYSSDYGYYRTLEQVNNKWVFEKNPFADGKERLHFIPLWYPDGDYVLSVKASELWTPSGMITCTNFGSTIVVIDSAYDDWYVGEE